MDRKLANSAIWFDQGWFPVFIAFVPTEIAWNAEMKRLKVEDAPEYPTSDGHCLLLTSVKDGKTCIFITISNETAQGALGVEIIGLLAHEVQHAWRFILEAIKEDEPSSELEAYAMQNLLMDAIIAYEKTRGPLTVARNKKK